MSGQSYTRRSTWPLLDPSHSIIDGMMINPSRRRSVHTQSIPRSWRHCPKEGSLIANKFLPFKTPLSSQYDKDLSEKERFPPSVLTSYRDTYRIGLVIDLTNTSRYYDKRELLQCGIRHHKITCEGHNVAPDVEKVKEFQMVCGEFFKDHPYGVVGVHCTHGFNRTGFLIVSYLIDVECWDLEAAVATFSVARPPGIYKEHYLHELAGRYADGDIGSIITPPLPDWCDDVEREKEKSAQFAVPLHGVELVLGPTREEVQIACQEALDWEESGFPGSQPVSMDVQNIRFLNEKPYRVSWKADGTRYMLYIKGKGQIYLIDRDNSVFNSPNITFLSRKREGEHLRDCVADSELVLDKVDGAVRPRLLIYDIMMFEGSKDVARCDHQRRMLCIDRELIMPREEAAKRGIIDKIREPFSVRAKQFWDVSESRMILEKYAPTLTHENDGLIYNPTNEPYKPGQCKDLLIWKPPKVNFHLNIITEKKFGMLEEKKAQLLVGSERCEKIFSYLDLQVNKDAKKHSKKIIECSFVNNKWKFLRVRTDKGFPDSIETAKSICIDSVNEDKLLEVCEKHRRGIDKGRANKHALEEPNGSMLPPSKARRHASTST
ncbi:PREDICTED: mRNA-capping enzyme-like isoform X1 [Amphimedon queenslandica]|uniref:mRNA-capping enzyme n=1 Tax=Amphimedon queenslandica TaxID=400682 RepID=A0AAN0J3U9_AMPQE|nr:PREDICTED: mRNA-capping enzyme-like isoform X1 [Amphimedon queenslandica]|eukprot:XP_019851710.1 PREDICTED: mRNA-capping enzyme-like isoform X1 [Amphimedon queenslandica]